MIHCFGGLVNYNSGGEWLYCLILWRHVPLARFTHITTYGGRYVPFAQCVDALRVDIVRRCMREHPL